MKALALILAAFSGTAFAQVKPHRVHVAVKPGSTPVCESLAESVRFHFKSRQRAELSDLATADHVITIACDATQVDAVWVTRVVEDKIKIDVVAVSVRLAIAGDATKNHPSLGLALTQQLLDKIPWDGEINALIKPRKIEGKSELIGPNTKSGVHTMASTAAGYIQSYAVTNCSPFEIARLKKGTEGVELEVMGEGVFTSVGTFASPAEIYLDKKVPAGVRPVFRLILVADARREVRKLVARCKKIIGEGEGDSLSRLIAGDLGKALSRESIEINMVQQRAGAFFSRYSSTNGAKIPFALVGYAQSRADIGDFLAVDGRIGRSVTARAWTPSMGSSPPNPEITFGMGYAMARFSWDDLTVTAGPGLILEKINTPHYAGDAPRTETDPADGSTVPSDPSLRSSNIRGAFALGVRTEISGFILDAQTAFSLGRGDRHLTFESAVNYRLTDTWFAGGDAFFMGLGRDSKGAPGGNFVGVGAHLGFLLKRAKPEKPHR